MLTALRKWLIPNVCSRNVWLNYRGTQQYNISNWICSVTIHATVIMYWFTEYFPINDTEGSLFILENMRADRERVASHLIVKNEVQRSIARTEGK